ncbi:COMM domain-containing protein 1 [Notechis scutatus]|uniref:COMM domain-containing protein 1 n=1 Tax=Notechis scutatus TaxID=8663 RepID=A0A6J1U0D4_9SAUR|nr:COMM domain-containing protein 1 [Notechis scutatus]
MAASAEHPLPEPAKPLLGLLNGIAQATFYGNTEITEELLREQLYPETASQEFGVLLAKMKGIVKESELLTMEFDETELNEMLKKLSEIEDSIISLTQAP